MKNSSKDIFQMIARNIYEGLEAQRKKVVRLLTIPILFVLSQPAWALKASDLTKSWKSEWSEIVQVALFVIAGIGIIMAAVAAISWVIAKKNNEPAKWQGWAMLGGAVAIVVPVFILAISGSLSNEQGNADGIMNDMGVNF